MNINEFYAKHYKKLFLIPFSIFIFSLVVIGVHYAQTGEIVGKDVTLKGGLTITVYSSTIVPGLEAELKQAFPNADIVVRQLSEFGTSEQVGVLIQASDAAEEEIKPELEKRFGELTNDNYSVEQMGSALGQAFYRQMRTAIILAFVFIALVVLITFRVPIPSFTVVFCAFCDMIFPIAMMNLLGMKLSTAGIAALLMLIGYSIDTDILITTKALKRTEEGSVVERMLATVKTGLTMTGTMLAALLAGLLFSQSVVIREMFIILIFGLLIDILVTYLLNTGILVWWAKRKGY